MTMLSSDPHQPPNRSRAWDTWWDGGVAPLTSIRHDDASRVTSVTTNNGETTVVFGYDDANRKISEAQTLSGYPTRRVNTPRDDDGNRLSLEVPGFYSIDYTYTQRNQLASIPGVCNFSYDANGNLRQRLGQWTFGNETVFQ